MSLLLSQLGGGGSDSITVDAGSLTLTGQSISTIDVLPIDAANLTLTGQSIVSIDVCPITAANLSLSGSSILELDTIGITAGALALSGSNITEVGTVGIASTNLLLTGQDITVSDTSADTVTIDAANLVLAGSSITEIDTIAVDAAGLSLAGQEVTAVDIVVASLQKDSDPDYWNLPWFHVEGGTFADKLRAETLVVLEQAAEPIAGTRARARATKQAAKAVQAYAEAASPLLSDKETTALGELAQKLRRSVGKKHTESARQTAVEARELLRESLMRQQEEEAILLLLAALD